MCRMSNKARNYTARKMGMQIWLSNSHAETGERSKQHLAATYKTSFQVLGVAVMQAALEAQLYWK